MSKELGEQQQVESPPTTVDNNAAPPAAEPITVSVSDTLSKLSKEDYKKWEAGDNDVLLPKPAEPSSKSEPEPAPGKEEPKNLTPEERSKRDKERGDKRQHEYWRDRAVEEKTKRETLEREVAEIKKKLESPPSTPKVEIAQDGRPLAPKVPKMGEFQTIEEYDTALEKYHASHSDFVEKLADWKLEQRETSKRTTEERSKQSQYLEERTREYHKMADEYEKDHPAYPKAFESVASILADASQGKGGYIDGFILRSKIAPQVVDYLAEHLDELHDLIRTPPEEGLVQLGEIQAGIKASASKAPRPKNITSAPPPVHPADGHSQVEADPAEAAFKRGDMRTWERLQNEKELRQMGLIR